MIPDWAGYLAFREAFGEVMDERYHTLDWLDQEVLSGRVAFWKSNNAAIIAEVRDYPTGAKDVHGVIAAGDLREIIEDLIPQAEAWGKSLGCVGAIIESREGWRKMLPDYSPHQYTLYKEL